MRIFGWSVKRTRGGMAAVGVDGDGAEAKIASITSIEPRGRSVFAIDSKGVEHELVVGGQTN